MSKREGAVSTTVGVLERGRRGGNEGIRTIGYRRRNEQWAE